MEEVNLMCASVAQIFFSISRVIFVIKKVTLVPRIFLRVRGCEKYKDLIDTYLCRKVGNGKNVAVVLIVQLSDVALLRSRGIA